MSTQALMRALIMVRVCLVVKKTWRGDIPGGHEAVGGLRRGVVYDPGFGPEPITPVDRAAIPGQEASCPARWWAVRWWMSPGHCQPSALVDMGEVHEGFIDASVVGLRGRVGWWVPPPRSGDGAGFSRDGEVPAEAPCRCDLGRSAQATASPVPWQRDEQLVHDQPRVCGQSPCWVAHGSAMAGKLA